ncbi:Outer membrane porin protein [Paraburkholderia ultramafica]|uniref:Outer membrane porin protein n=1 Tax=Paraburkholderia ultramafica TaxID=1544867 RepID=A0A6S7BQX2_9BURK|nr:porin [Paraburkholderia ultramafica]CAB3810017.1 Outer membrane porin protein [Paraburkholderia ultramafica]
MIRTLLAALVGGLYVSSSYAQSNITLYGLIDVSINYVSNQREGGTNSPGHSNWSMASGDLNTSRWGLRGREDLGGGSSAVFTLENGFSVINGKFSNGGDEFGRQAHVGLQSTTYGSITLGRQYDIILDFVTPLGASGPGWGGNLGVHPYDNDDSNTNLRINNSVKYKSPIYRGLTFGAMYGFSNTPGQFANNRAYSAGVAYANGPLSVGAAYLQIDRSADVANPQGAVSTSDGDAQITGGPQRIWALGGRYIFGPASAGLVWAHSVTDAVTGVAQGGSITPLKGDNLTFDNFSVDVHYFVTPAFSVAAAYTYTAGRFSTATETTRPKWNQLVLQTDYQFNKRTDIYLEGAYQSVSGGNGNPAFNASIHTLTPSSNSKQAVVAAGLRHRF